MDLAVLGKVVALVVLPDQEGLVVHQVLAAEMVPLVHKMVLVALVQL